jgi:hypothetical protein
MHILHSNHVLEKNDMRNAKHIHKINQAWRSLNELKQMSLKVTTRSPDVCVSVKTGLPGHSQWDSFPWELTSESNILYLRRILSSIFLLLSNKSLPLFFPKVSFTPFPRTGQRVQTRQPIFGKDTCFLFLTSLTVSCVSITATTCTTTSTSSSS